MKEDTKEPLCNIHSSKLLKKIGFDWEVDSYFYQTTDGEIKSRTVHPALNFNNHHPSETSRPTLSIAQKWLREVKGIELHVKPIGSSKPQRYTYTFFRIPGLFCRRPSVDYDQILQAGITKAAEMVEGRGNG